ncbi:hypothetical protein AGMMS49942_08800 [Spirochaetia bacterium]|nr:hypothetical protein AGMMS49942_08800 [Spirochaetia bacterium]
MAESIFRRESLDHVSSPEQLYDYIRVSNPPMWVVLAAILLLLVAGTSGEASFSNGGTFLQVRITTARTRPLDFIFNPNR